MANTRTIDDPRTPAALQAANLYYLQDLTMDAIAAELRTSRSSVSRLLTFARESGLVEITVHSPLDHGSHLEDEVRRRFKVSAHVVPMPEGISEIDRLERVAMTAGRLIPSFIDSNMIVGLAWGSTLSAISRHVVAREAGATTAYEALEPGRRVKRSPVGMLHDESDVASKWSWNSAKGTHGSPPRRSDPAVTNCTSHELVTSGTAASLEPVLPQAGANSRRATKVTARRMTGSNREASEPTGISDIIGAATTKDTGPAGSRRAARRLPEYTKG